MPDAGLQISPSKARPARTRRGRPRSASGSRSSCDDDRANDGSDADAEAPPAKGDAQGAGSSGARAGKATPLPGGSCRPGGIRAWNPFAGLRLMGPRHKAGSHILDLAPPPAAEAADAAKPGSGVPPTAALFPARDASVAPPAAEPHGLADSTPDIDAPAAAAGLVAAAEAAAAKAEKAVAPATAPDYGEPPTRRALPVMSVHAALNNELFNPSSKGGFVLLTVDRLIVWDVSVLTH